MAEITYPTNEEIQANIKKWNIPMPQQDYMVVVHCSTYNHGKYIEDALKGFVMQQTDFSFCAIVIDDGSTDDAPSIIRKYAEQYPDIIKPILLGENHMQHGKSRNPYFEGWHNVAKYIAFCEGDDYWTDPNKLQKQVDYMETHEDCSCCAHNSLRLNTKTRQIRLFNKKILLAQNYTLESFITRDWFTPTQSLLYRRDSYHAFEDKPAFMHGDYSLLINVLLLPKSYLHYENEIMSVYREGGWSSTYLKEIEAYNDFISLLDYYKRKSNHRCDAVFDQQIERQKMGMERFVKFKKESFKTHSLYVRAGHWLCRVVASIVNKYVDCIQVTKKWEFRDIPNFEQID